MRTSPTCGDGARAGFSLVEMLVVLALLALTAGIGAVSIRGILPSQRLNVAAEALASELALLRTEALRTGRPMRLVFDPQTRIFLSSRRGAPVLPMAELTVLVEPPATSRARPVEIRFLPDGGSSGGRIVLSGPGGTRLVAVSRVTGAVRRAQAAL